MRILITNLRLDRRTGTEIAVRDIALGLLKHGDQPVVYSPFLGPLAAELRGATVPVVDDLRHVGAAPDVIHGHHNYTTLTALLHFPGVPALAFVRDALSWHDVAFLHPRVHRYVAVDDNCRDRLILEYGIPEERVSVVLNAVDLERFEPRSEPLPPRPRKALIFGSYATRTNDWYYAEIEAACRRAHVDVDVVGTGTGNISNSPEVLLREYDLVFAKARCALEAMAAGAAVVLCDETGMGPLVTSGDVERLRQLNFGRRALPGRVTSERLEREIARYSALDAGRVTALVREHAGVDPMVQQLSQLYREASAFGARRAATATGPDRDSESRAAAGYLQSIAQRVIALDLPEQHERRGGDDGPPPQRLWAESRVGRLLRKLSLGREKPLPEPREQP